jgi:acyl carrier protein
VRDPRATALIAYIAGQVGRPPDTIDEDTPLVSSALVDSFALVDLLLKLEEVTGKRIGAGRVTPDDFETVRTMLRVADGV